MKLTEIREARAIKIAEMRALTGAEMNDEGKKRIDKRYDLYIDRAMVAHEFDAIWAAQAVLNPVQFTDAARHDLRDT